MLRFVQILPGAPNSKRKHLTISDSASALRWHLVLSFSNSAAVYTAAASEPDGGSILAHLGVHRQDKKNKAVHTGVAGGIQFSLYAPYTQLVDIIEAFQGLACRLGGITESLGRAQATRFLSQITVLILSVVSKSRYLRLAQGLLACGTRRDGSARRRES